MKKRTLMIATAVAALTTGMAFAQAPSENHMNPASRNAPAEKVAPNAGPATHNSASEPKSTPSNRMGQAPGSERNRMGERPGNERSTTGQAPNDQPNAQRQTPKSDRINNAARPDE